ncbi:Phage P2 GpU [compost metagenome]
MIEKITETRTLFFPDGAARRIEFSIELKRIDDGRVDLLGSGISSAGNIIRGLL